MAITINTNIQAMIAQRNLTATSSSLSKSIERLSSGVRINSAGDDAAGLSISEKFRAQARGLNQASRNAQDAISMIQTGEGALNEVHSILQRVRELAVQASNDTLSGSDRAAIADEMDQLRDEIGDISTNTKFNGKSLLTGVLSVYVDATSELALGDVLVFGAAGGGTVSALDVSGAAENTTYTMTGAGAVLTLSATVNGNSISQNLTVATMIAGGTQQLDFTTMGVSVSLTAAAHADNTAANIVTSLVAAANDTIITADTDGSAVFQIGSEAGDQLTVSFDEVSTDSLAIDTSIDALDAAGTNATIAQAQAVLTAVDTAIDTVSTRRNSLGAYTNRLDHTIANLGVASENISASESRVRDLDMAAEMIEFTKNQILQQAGTAMLAQANALPQMVLQLLQ